MSNIVYEANPSVLRTNPFGTIIVIVILLAGIAIAVASGVISGALGIPGQVVGIVGIVIAVLAFVQLLVWYIKAKMDHLTIKDDEIVWSHGLIRKQYTEISMASVRATRMNQSLIQRMMNAGDLMIFTAGDEAEIHIRGLPEPQRLRDLIKHEANKG